MTTPTKLYRHYDRNGALLYVGITRNLERRNNQHAARSEWMLDVAFTMVTDYLTLGAAVDAEERAIQSERPRFNKAGRVDPAKASFDVQQEMGKLERFLEWHRVDHRRCQCPACEHRMIMEFGAAIGWNSGGLAAP